MTREKPGSVLLVPPPNPARAGESESRRADGAPIASRDRFANIIRWAPIGIFRVRRDGTFIAVNKYLADMLGYASRDELAARNLERAHVVAAGVLLPERVEGHAGAPGGGNRFPTVQLAPHVESPEQGFTASGPPKGVPPDVETPGTLGRFLRQGRQGTTCSGNEAPQLPQLLDTPKHSMC